METSNCFQRLIEHSKKTEMPQAFRLEVIRQLEYFKTQALCDLDRRDSPITLRKNWTEFKGKVRGLKLLESYKAEEHFWRTVQCFVYEVEPTTLLVPKPEVKTSAKTDDVGKFQDWGPDMFFDHLVKEVKVAPVLGRYEFLALYHGLCFLHASAELPKPRRDKSKIKAIWKEIHPLLEKMGLMREFKRDKGLEYKIRLFIDK